jgi:sugar lactone lactonase YvrE
MRESDFALALDGLCFAEGPRWHDGLVWFSDMYGYRVMRMRPGGDAVTVTRFPGDRPSGLGWLPDGRLLVVAMSRRAVLRLEPSRDLVVHADLSGHCRGFANDMIVAADGSAYVGDSGLPDTGEPGEPRPGQLLRVSPDGSVQVAADELTAPNGCILTADGSSLIVSESRAGKLTAFTVAADGTLGGRRLFAEVDPAPGADRVFLDGICLDAGGGVWACETAGQRLLRIADGGRITESVTFTGYTPVACVLGGHGRRTLYVCATRGKIARPSPDEPRNCILAAPVTVPGAGRP